MRHLGLAVLLLIAVVAISGCTRERPPDLQEPPPQEPPQQPPSQEPPGQPPKQGPPTVQVIPDSQGRRSVMVNQLTGERENRYTGQTCVSNPTLSRTETTAGFRGTDLGNSFIDDHGTVWFVFGDTTKTESNHGNYGACPDSVAKLASVDAQDRVKLEWVTDSQGNFKKLTTQGEAPTCFDVPTDGLFANGNYYVWFTGKSGMSEPYVKKFARSYLSKTADISTQTTLTKVYQVSQNNDCLAQLTDSSPKTPIPGCTPVTGHFITTTADVVTENGVEMLYVWGDGSYRRDDVYLYRMPLADIEDASRILYFSGMDAKENPTWSASEADAAKVIDTPGGEAGDGCAGEISVHYSEQLGMWVFLNNCGWKGIVIATAANPWGPWSELQTIFQPAEDKGVTDFMYSPSRSPSCLNTKGQNSGKSAGAYGPAIVDSLTKTNTDGTVTIFYAMSTWNPYQAMLMKTRLRPLQ